MMAEKCTVLIYEQRTAGHSIYTACRGHPQVTNRENKVIWPKVTQDLTRLL